MKYWLDTEFIENGNESPLYLLSIGIVSEDGREYYAQLHYNKFPPAQDWVARHVYPHLEHFDMALQCRSCERSDSPDPPHDGRCRDKACPWRFSFDMKDGIRKFCDPDKHGIPEFWGYFCDYDWTILSLLFGRMVDLPKGWPMYCKDVKQLCDSLGNPTLPTQEGTEHHALADARWVKLAWEYLQGKKLG